jgi:hypothetical protein
MHTYSTDSRYRVTIPAVIGVVSYLIVQYFDLLRTLFPSYGILEGWVPSFGIVMSILFVVFNQWLWRRSVLRRLGIVKVPDLNGTWTGTGKTNRPDSEEVEEFEVDVMIKQRWRSISIEFETEDSRSRSLGATILTNEGATPTLTYEYLSEPKTTAPETMNMHRGTTTLDYRERDGEIVLEGDYYTGQGRKTYGHLKLLRSD